MSTTNEIVKLSFELKDAAPGVAKKIASSLETLFNAVQKITDLKVPETVTESIRGIGDAAKSAVTEITSLNVKQITSKQKKTQAQSVATALDIITASAKNAVAAITALNAIPITTMVGPQAQQPATPAAATIVDAASVDSLKEVTEAATEAGEAVTSFSDATKVAASATSSTTSKFGALRDVYGVA